MAGDPKEIASLDPSAPSPSLIIIPGMEKNRPIEERPGGGKQSEILYRFDLAPPFALMRVCEILKRGADRYGEWNWLKLPINDNIGHSIAHSYAFLAGDRQDDHLGNAACRALFALDQSIRYGLGK